MYNIPVVVNIILAMPGIIVIFSAIQDVCGVVERTETLSHQLRYLATQEATRQRGILITASNNIISILN